MNVKLLTKQHLEFLSLKGGCTYTCKNATLLEITWHGSIMGLHFIGGIVRTTIRPAISSMPDRCRACIAARGGPYFLCVLGKLKKNTSK